MSQSRCSRCKNLAASLTPAGLCSVCAGTEDTAEPTSASSAPEPAARDLTVSHVPPAEATTRTNPPEADTLSAPAAGPARLPAAPLGYELIEVIGDGGMGDVYLARELAAERLVAMKFLRRPDHPTGLQRFVTELQALGRLDHPNVVRLYGYDVDRSNPFFTMEYLAAGSLARAIKGTAVPVADAVRLIRAVADAVAAAHAAGILHRDLKPSNILLSGDRGQEAGDSQTGVASSLPPVPCPLSPLVPKVADFGLAKRLDRDDGPTHTSSSLGTPGYMPPEQISRKNGPVGFWSDVYGLGATLYHLLTGRAPFVGPTPEDVIVQVLNDEPPRPRALRPDVPLALEAVVLKCLAKDPTDRYRTVAAFVADLDAAAAGRGTVAPQRTRARRAKRWVGRHRVALAAGAAAAAVAVGLVGAGRVFAPAPLPAPAPAAGPPDPVAVMWKELAAGGRIELIPAKGLPLYSRAILEPTTLGLSPMNDGACAFQAFDTCLVELCPDPGHARYRVSVDVCQLRRAKALPGGTDTDYAGVYFGYAGGGDPVAAHAAFAVTFEDYPALNAPDGKRVVWLRRFGFTQGGNAWVREDSGKVKALRFTPSASRPGKWRRIVIDVSPEEVVVRWCPDPENAPGQLDPLARWSGDEIQGHFTALKKSLDARAPGAGAALPAWSPRMPFGVLSHSSSVSVKNVVITPRP